MLRNTAVILAMLLSSLATQVFALGLGTVTVESALNEPLRVRIEILQLGDTRLQDVSVQMASQDDFERFNIDRTGFLSGIRFAIAASSDGNYVTLTSNQIVREPYLSFILDTRWPNGRLLSEHTILLDLPVFDAQEPSATVRQPISSVLTPPSSAPSTNTAPATPAPAPVTSAVSAPVATPAPAAAPTQEPTPTAVEPVQQAEPAPVNAEPPAPTAQPEPVIEVAAPPVPTPTATPVPVPPPAIETNDEDTLTDIALQVRPDSSVSIQQTMLAIQRLNPDAFIDGNINRMRSGQVLRIPDLAAIQNIDAREAATEINRQNQDFADADVQPLAAPAPQAPDQTPNPQGQLSVVTNDTAIDASGGAGQLEAAENAELDQRIAELENALAVQQEEADRARIAREELDSRMDELEQQIAAAQEIIRLQDIQLAQLQDSLARAAAEQAAQQAAMADADAQIAEQAASRTSMVGDIMRIITGNILFIGFGLALVVLLLVFLLLRRNRAKLDDSDLEELEAEDFLPQETGTDDKGEQEFEDFAAGDLDDELDQIIGVDADSKPLEQAKTLLSKGNSERAIVVLKSALSKTPDDQELRVKLLEAFALQGDLSAFEEQADIVGDDPEFASKINSLRRSIKIKEPAPVAKTESKPKAPLFGRKPPTEEEDRIGAASFLDDLGIDLDAFDDDDDEPSVTERSVKPAAPPVPEKKVETPPPPAPEPSLDDDSFHPDDMDLTFDLVGDADDVAPVSVESVADDVASEAEIDISDDTLDDTLIEDFDTDSEADSVEALEFDVDDKPGTEADNASKDADDFDFETFEFSVDEKPVTPPAKPEPDLDLETFAFDTTDLNLDKPDVPSAAAPEADEDNLLDFDFDKSEIQPQKADTAAQDMETFEFDVDENPAATVVEKPELSQADADDFLDIDVDDFDLDDDESPIESTTKTATEIKPKDEIEFDFDDDSAEPEPATPTSDPDDELDALDDLDFLSDDEVEIESVDDISTLSDADEVATKLELAYAYRKMGDVEGAREILLEVVKEGNPAQVKEANNLLSSIKDD